MQSDKKDVLPPHSLRWRAAGYRTRAAVAIGRLMATPAIVSSAAKVAAVVGTALNLINNGERILDPGGVAAWSVAANYLVPFLVSAYSAARHEARRLPGP